MKIEKLLKLLNENNVEYVIIGATAFPVHGYARATLDTDIFVRPKEGNLKRTARALKSFGYDLTEITEKDFKTRKILFREYGLETDIHPYVKGVGFEEVYNTSIIEEIGNETARFASLESLIKMKKAAGRAKDKEDLKILKKLKKRKLP